MPLRKISQKSSAKKRFGPEKAGGELHSRKKEYHRQMTDAVLDRLSEEEIPVLMKALKDLAEFFRGYGNQIHDN